jgi:hypothetical protein
VRIRCGEHKTCTPIAGFTMEATVILTVRNAIPAMEEKKIYHQYTINNSANEMFKLLQIWVFIGFLTIVHCYVSIESFLIQKLLYTRLFLFEQKNEIVMKKCDVDFNPEWMNLKSVFRQNENNITVQDFYIEHLKDVSNRYFVSIWYFDTKFNIY